MYQSRRKRRKETPYPREESNQAIPTVATAREMRQINRHQLNYTDHAEDIAAELKDGNDSSNTDGGN